MKITKLGHSCLILEENNFRILIDPGSYTAPAHSKLKNINLIIFTHVHQDHLHVESLKEILKNNPEAIILTNESVRQVLAKEGIKAELLSDAENTILGGVLIEGFGKDHEPIYKELGLTENTGYFFNDRFFFPGDSFFVPEKQVEILALPTAGPWLKLGEALDYAVKIKPKIVFPIHDAMLNQSGKFADTMGAKILAEEGIEYVVLNSEQGMDF